MLNEATAHGSWRPAQGTAGSSPPVEPSGGGAAARPVGAPPLLSVVSPVYRGREIVAELVARTVEALSELTDDFEIILIDDGSPDESWLEIVRLCGEDPRLRGLRLSRNFGQQIAISCGLDHALGQWVAVMDCDLQDDPSDIGLLLDKAREGHDIVFGKREQRSHGRWKNLGAHLFNALLNFVEPRLRARSDIGSFSLLSRRAVDAFRRVGDVHRHYLGVLRWLGYDPAEVVVRHRPRYSGRSSYSLLSLVRHAVDGIVTQSVRLLNLAIGLSFFFLVASVIAVGVVVVRSWLHGFQAGWASMVVLILVSTSVVLFCVGIVGVYVGRIFDQVRQRPLYLLRASVNVGVDEGHAGAERGGGGPPS
jgi:dolichol-phosphate mannosyltransferase